MADRYTRQHAESAFRALAEALGKSVASQGFRPAGAWQLDHNSAYGGYQIQELLDHGVTLPFGHTRRSARDFYAVCWFAVDALRIAGEVQV